MRINLEIQSLSDRNFRGIPYYTMDLLKALIRRNRHTYSGTFFDFRRERGNAGRIRERMGEDYLDKLTLFENNEKDYRVFRELSRRDQREQFEAYSSFFSFTPDIYHFPHSISFGYELPEHSIVTVNDIMPILYPEAGYFTKEAVQRFIHSQHYLEDRKDVEIIAISEATRKDLCEHLSIDEKRVHVVYDAFDRAVCFPERNQAVLDRFGIKGPYLLYIGALDPRKGIEEIVDAYERIAAKYDISLVIVGKEEIQFSETLLRLKKQEENHRVIFTGYVTDAEKRALYSMAEIFLFPTHYEGFGIPVLEAMACGCPVITTNVSSLPEVAGEAACYITPKAPEMLEEAISRILDSAALREEMRKKGTENCARFSWDRTAEETEKIYEYVGSR